jgi:DNA repair exonuclease SbcCD ATPase subunit
MYNQDANVRDYQKYLEQQILKLNYRSFTQVVILGSSTFIPFMQLKARHRREVVEEILDIQIFSLMNMLVKQRMKTIAEDIREMDYNIKLNREKISLQEKYISEVKQNKDKLVEEKTLLISSNEEEVFTRNSANDKLNQEKDKWLTEIADKDKVVSTMSKLNNLKSTLREKKNSNAKMVEFFENNDICPTCEQTLDNSEEMIALKEKEVSKFSAALKELEDKITESKGRQKIINEIVEKIRESEVQVAKNNQSIVQLEKFNATLSSEIEQLADEELSKSDYDKLKRLNKKMKGLDEQKSKLREDQTYADAVRNMLQDTGIKTKIIKQYLPIMNKLINTYLTSMEFYVNFTLNENFEETIKSRYRDEFTYASFSEGEKMRIDLALLFTWRAVAKMKNSTNTNLLILDEIFDSSLDGTGTDEFLKILNTLGDENVFVISHKQDALADKFRSTIKFEKIKNFSHISEA